MKRTDTLARLPKELSHRSSNGLQVWLLWSPHDDRLFVLVIDDKNDDTFELTVEAGYALDAFEHPFAYAASRGIDYAHAQRREGEAVHA